MARIRWAARHVVHSVSCAREPDKDRWKQAIKVPKAAKPKKAMLEQIQAARCRKIRRASFPLALKHGHHGNLHLPSPSCVL